MYVLDLLNFFNVISILDFSPISNIKTVACKLHYYECISFRVLNKLSSMRTINKNVHLKTIRFLFFLQESITPLEKIVCALCIAY